MEDQTRRYGALVQMDRGSVNITLDINTEEQADLLKHELENGAFVTDMLRNVGIDFSDLEGADVKITLPEEQRKNLKHFLTAGMYI